MIYVNICPFIPKSLLWLWKHRWKGCNMTVSVGMSQVSQLGEWDAGRHEKVRKYCKLSRCKTKFMESVNSYFTLHYSLGTQSLMAIHLNVCIIWLFLSERRWKYLFIHIFITMSSCCRVFSYPCLEVYLDKNEVSIYRNSLINMSLKYEELEFTFY